MGYFASARAGLGRARQSGSSFDGDAIRTEPAHPDGAAYVGSPQRRHDGARYVTGRVNYTADLTLAGVAALAIVRSPHAHAEILAVDLAAALAAPGVLGAFDGEQLAALAEPIPHNLDPAGLGGNHGDVRALALGKVLYVGQPVAAVVAETRADARAAAELVEVSYEPLPAVLDLDRRARARRAAAL